MLLFNNFKNFAGLGIRFFGSNVVNQRNHFRNASALRYIIERTKLLQTTSTLVKTNHCSKKFHSDRPHCNKAKIQPILLPPLTDDPIHKVTNILKLPFNMYYENIVLKGQLDKDFSIEEFVNGAKQAVAVVSEALASEDYDGLDGLLTDNIINKLRNKISTLSQEQKKLISLHPKDIMVMFPCSFEAIYEGEGDNQKTFVDIAMIFYSFKGLHKNSKIVNQHNESINMTYDESQSKMFLTNCTFRRDYTNGNTEPWIITKYNHMSVWEA